MEIKFTFYWLMTKSKTDKNGNRESWKTWMKYCSSSRVHKTKRALYLRVSFLRNGGRVSLTKKNLQKMNFSAASLKKKKPMKIRQPKNKTLQKMSFSCVSLLLQQLRKKTETFAETTNHCSNYNCTHLHFYFNFLLWSPLDIFNQSKT